VSAPANATAGIGGGVPRERMRRRLLALFLAAEVAALAILGGTAALSSRAGAERRGAGRELVVRLRLSGLALWPEASYCRQPALSDLFTPHAIHPAAPDLFPAGSMVPAHPSSGSSSRGGGRP